MGTGLSVANCTTPVWPMYRACTDDILTQASNSFAEAGYGREPWLDENQGGTHQHGLSPSWHAGCRLAWLCRVTDHCPEQTEALRISGCLPKAAGFSSRLRKLL